MNRDALYLSTIDDTAHTLAKKHGLGIEIAEFCTPWYLDTDFADIDPAVRKKLACSNRFVLHAPFSELFPCAIDPKIRAVAAERYRQVISVAQGYGISKIVVHAGFNPKIYFPVWFTEQSVVFWKDFIREIPEGMVFCLENVLEEEPAMLAEIIRQVDDPKLRMCLDVGHVHAYSPCSVFDWLTDCADLISHFHIHNNDASRDAHSQLFEGTLPMAKLLTVIEETCPTATLTLELIEAAPSVDWLIQGGFIHAT